MGHPVTSGGSVLDGHSSDLMSQIAGVRRLVKRNGGRYALGLRACGSRCEPCPQIVGPGAISKFRLCSGGEFRIEGSMVPGLKERIRRKGGCDEPFSIGMPDREQLSG